MEASWYHNAVDIGGGQFFAPITGLYGFILTADFKIFDERSEIAYLFVNINEGQIRKEYAYDSTLNDQIRQTYSFFFTFQLNQGDRVDITTSGSVSPWNYCPHMHSSGWLGSGWRMPGIKICMPRPEWYQRDPFSLETCWWVPAQRSGRSWQYPGTFRTSPWWHHELYVSTCHPASSSRNPTGARPPCARQTCAFLKLDRRCVFAGQQTPSPLLVCALASGAPALPWALLSWALSLYARRLQLRKIWPKKRWPRLQCHEWLRHDKASMKLVTSVLYPSEHICLFKWHHQKNEQRIFLKTSVGKT